MVEYKCEKCNEVFGKKSQYMKHKHKIKYVDLFCGLGSFHYSFSKLGFECVMACDIYKPSRENYKLNYGFEPLGDICEIDPNKIDYYDILCADPKNQIIQTS